MNAGTCLDRWYLRRLVKVRFAQLAGGLVFILLAPASRAATPSLTRHWGYAGLSSNNADTGNSFVFDLEASGTPRAVVAGDSGLIALSFQNTNITAAVTDDQGNSWISGPSCADTTLSTPRRFQIFTAVNMAAGTHLITVTFSGTGLTNGFTTNVQVASIDIFNGTATASLQDGSGVCTTQLTPANNTAPNIQPGAITTLVDGDLIYNVIFEESNGTIGIVNPWNGVTFGSGFTGLSSEPCAFGAASQFIIQATHGTTFNPGITVSQTTHSTFASLAVALKAGSGGAVPGPGNSIIRSQMCYAESIGTANIAVPFPATGNFIATVNEAGSNGSNLTGVTDSSSNTYTQTASNPAGFPEFFYSCNATTTGNTHIVTLHFNSAGGSDLIPIYDVSGMANPCLDTGSSGANSSTLTAAGSGTTKNSGNQSSAGQTLLDASSITPGQAKDLIFDAGQMGTGPVSGCIDPTVCSYDYVFASWAGTGGTGSGGDNNGFGNGDFMAHYFAPTTAVVQFQLTTANASASAWNSLTPSFKAAPLPLAGSPSTMKGPAAMRGPATF